jgi:hypothetical protein
MAVNKEPIFIGAPLTTAANTSIANTFTTASLGPKDIVTGATDGTVIQDLIATSSSTGATVLNILFYDGANPFLIGTVNVPTLSGTNGTAPSVSLLNTTDIPSLAKRDDGSILLAAGQKLQVEAVAVTDNEVTVVALGGNLTA